MQPEPIIQILPQPRQLPKPFIWSLYAIIAVSVIIAAVILSFTPDNETPSPEAHDDDDLDTKMYFGPETRSRISDEQWQQQQRQTRTGRESVTLEEVVAYECYFEAGIKNVSWLEGSDEELVYQDAFGRRKAANVTERPRRHVATIRSCASTGRRQCRLNVRVLSSASEKELAEEEGPPYRRFFRLARGRAGDYSYVHEERAGPLNHSCRYTARVPPAVPNVTGWNTCTIRSLEVYEYKWNFQWFQPKFTFSITERCPSHSLAWTDAYVFNRTKLGRAPTNLTLSLRPTILAVAWTEDNGDYVEGRRHRRGFDYYRSDVPAMIHQHVAGISSTPRALIDSGYATSNYNQRSTSDLRRRLSSASRKRRSTRTRQGFEPVVIGATDWLVHGVLQPRNDSLHRTTIGLAVSKKETLARDRDTASSSTWMPQASNTYKPLVANDIWVTRVLSVKVNGEDEALAYFLASPVANFSRRFLYQMRVVYPPLEFPALEPVLCLTCPDGPRGSPISPDEGGRNSSRPGNRPQCIWTYAIMSHTARNYILHCLGPEAPWTAVVATPNNTVTRYFGLVDEESRRRYDTLVKPRRIEFQVELGGGRKALARLHMPPGVGKDGKGKCKDRVKLLLRIAKRQDQQMVNAKFELSLVTYLTTVKRYAVLYADTRASKFLQSPEFGRLRFRRQEAAQLGDYVRATKHAAAASSTCIDEAAGFGVLGDGYGGHAALNLAAGAYSSNGLFRCAAAVEPFAPWPLYVYPFTEKSIGATNDLLRWRMFLQRHLARLVRRLRGRDFSLHTSSRLNRRRRRRDYINALIAQLIRQGVAFELRRYDANSCDGARLELYRRLANYFERCFARAKAKPTTGL